MWSGTAIKSTIHRVIYNSAAGTPRYSIPFFLHPSRGSTIDCGDGKTVDTYRWVGWRADGQVGSTTGQVVQASHSCA